MVDAFVGEYFSAVGATLNIQEAAGVDTTTGFPPPQASIHLCHPHKELKQLSIPSSGPAIIIRSKGKKFVVPRLTEAGE